MTTTTVKVIELENYLPGILKAASGEQLKNAVMAGGQVLEGYAKVNANDVFSGHATNTLAGSIQTIVAEASETKAEVDVGPTVIYGRIQELGGWIKPVFKKMLSWIDRDTGERIFAKKVYLPPRPYLRPAADEHENEILEAIGYRLKTQIENAAGK